MSSIYKILKDGEVFNRIVADENFVRQYCSSNDYIYELEDIIEDDPISINPPSTEERLTAIESAILTMIGGNELV